MLFRSNLAPESHILSADAHGQLLEGLGEEQGLALPEADPSPLIDPRVSLDIRNIAAGASCGTAITCSILCTFASLGSLRGTAFLL